MKEDFPVFLWKHQCFRKTQLTTTTGDHLLITSPGRLNDDAGPDFSEANLIIGNMAWHGNVEIHSKSSHWDVHGHHKDPNYNNVILHVVWEHDKDSYRSDGTLLPVLELKARTDFKMKARYKHLMASLRHIPCQDNLEGVEPKTRKQMIWKAAEERLVRKAQTILKDVRNGASWEEATYHIMAANFGFKINRDTFLSLARKLPVRLLFKYAGNSFQIEALLFGVAGFLSEKSGDPYYLQLRQEFLFLAHKYQLTNLVIPKHHWKFLRMRPANFPTVRIAQFASLYNQKKNLFSTFKHLNSCSALIEYLSVHQGEYWRNHYDFGKSGKENIGGLGEGSIHNIIINAVTPVKIAYNLWMGENIEKGNTLLLLKDLPPENNKVIRIWEKSGMNADNALETQGLLELFHHYCLEKNCLNCNIGLSLFRPI